MNYPGAALREGHQVDFILAMALALPGERPAWRATLVSQPPAAAQLLAVQAGELCLNHGVERGEQLEQPFAVVVDAPLEVEIRLRNWHFGHDIFSPDYPQVVGNVGLDTNMLGSQNGKAPDGNRD